MNRLGLDVGSRTIVLVALENGQPEFAIRDSGLNPLQRCREILEGRCWDRLTVTGYGRHLVAPAVGGEVISEITAYAVGARHLYPDCHTVIDVGGQDTKAILLNPNGGVQRFEMNDRCAAGTGRFLEIMARTLEVDMADLGDLALSASKSLRLNSLCTVFAESEVISLISMGEQGSDIAMALHHAIADRIVGMVRRVGCQERVVFAGGGALNRCLYKLLEEKLRCKLTVPPEPQIVGALGAALVGFVNG